MLPLPQHATLALTRSCLAALADQATDIDASSSFEHALIQLDRFHGDDTPAIEHSGPAGDQTVLLATATAGLEALPQYGVDALSIELIIAMLHGAHDQDGP